MSRWKIIVEAFDEDPSVAPALRRRLLEAWFSPNPPEIDVAAGDEIDGEDLDNVAAVVLIAGADSPRTRILPQLSELEEAGIAAVVLSDEGTGPDDPYLFAGALVLRRDIDPATLAALIEGLAHRQTEVARLHQEIALAHRFQGGLRGEIARIHEELHLAAMVQREFLPRELPSLHGVEFAALWQPAHYVSGDIYDVTRLDDDHVGVFIADAVGHGVPAALMTMVICRSLKTKIVTGSTYRIMEPADVLERLNHEMVRRRGNSTRFATGAYAVVDCRRRVMRLAGAGHPPPLLRRADGTTIELTTSGGLLGIFEEETYDQIEVDLAVGDILLMHSDGFEHAFPVSSAGTYRRPVPTNRYREEFAELAANATPDELIQGLRRRLDDQQGSLHQVDDLTLICMKAGPIAAIPARTGDGTEVTRAA